MTIRMLGIKITKPAVADIHDIESKTSIFEFDMNRPDLLSQDLAGRAGRLKRYFEIVVSYSCKED